MGTRRGTPVLPGLALIALALGGCSSQPTPAPTPTSAAPAPSSPSPSPSTVPPTPIPPPSQPARWPLTDLPPAPGADLARPALMVKVDNVGGAVPQAGLNTADLVVEEPVEGGLTRFVAVFQSRDPEVVGPIRSARPIDAEISRMLGGGGILAFSGASPYEITPVKADSRAVLVADDWGDAPKAFFRDPDRSGEHDLFAHPDRLRAWVTGATRGPSSFFTNGNDSPAPGAKPAADVTFSFGSTRAGWEWGGSRWLRTQNGRDHDTADDGRVWADTVVIVSVPTTIDPDLHDVLGNPTPVVNFRGRGKAWVLRDGTVSVATWDRPTIDSGLTLIGVDGVGVGPKAGRTWLEILPQPAQPEIS